MEMSLFHLNKIKNMSFASFILSFLLHKFVAHFEQINEMEAFACYDVGCIQSGSNIETSAQSAPRSYAIVRVEIVENANEILGTTMA